MNNSNFNNNNVATGSGENGRQWNTNWIPSHGRGFGSRGPRGGRGRGFFSHRNSNVARIANFIVKKNKELMEQFSDDILKRLLPGVNEAEQGHKELEAIRARNAKPIPIGKLLITTRQIGFALKDIARKIVLMQNPPNIENIIYKFYRVGLIMMETRLYLSKREITRIEPNVNWLDLDISPDRLNLLLSHTMMPDQFSRLINMTGS